MEDKNIKTIISEDTRKEKRILGLNRNVFFVGTTSFLTDTTTKMIYAIMPLFLMTLGATKTELSLIEGIAESTASVLKALSGWWSDKIGKNKPFMIIGYAFTAILSPLFSIVTSPLQAVLILLFALYGLYSAATDGIQKALVSDLIDNNKRGTGLGLYNCLAGRTLLPASIIAGLLYDHINNRAPFYYGSIMALVASVLMLIFYWKGKETRQSNQIYNSAVHLF